MQALLGQKDVILEDSTKMDVYLKQLSKQLGISSQDLDQLTFNLKALEHQQSEDLLNLKQSIDNLEVQAFKAVLNKLNMDKKQS